MHELESKGYLLDSWDRLRANPAARIRSLEILAAATGQKPA